MNRKPLNNQNIDISKILGIRDFIDQHECEANCLLCFTTFSLDDIEKHIESDYHKILAKVTDDIIEMHESNVAFLNVKEINADQNLTDKHAKTVSKDGFKMSDESLNQKAIPLTFKKISQPSNADQKLTDKHALEKCHEKKKKKTSLNRVNFSDYMRGFRYVIINEGANNGFLFNEKIFIDGFSFCLSKQVGEDLIFCVRCDGHFGLHHLLEFHSNEDEEDKLKTTMIKMENEFIREIKPNIFHCGHCNVIKSGWEEMEEHLHCKEHDGRRELSRTITQKIKYKIELEKDRQMRFLNLIRGFPF